MGLINTIDSWLGPYKFKLDAVKAEIATLADILLSKYDTT